MNIKEVKAVACSLLFPSLLTKLCASIAASFYIEENWKMLSKGSRPALLGCWGFSCCLEVLNLSVIQLRCRENVWELSSRGQQCCLVCDCRKEIFAAVSFPSFVVDQNQICNLDPANETSCLIWVNNFWFNELVCMMKWM